MSRMDFFAQWPRHLRSTLPPHTKSNHQIATCLAQESTTRIKYRDPKLQIPPRPPEHTPQKNIIITTSKACRILAVRSSPWTFRSLYPLGTLDWCDEYSVIRTLQKNALRQWEEETFIQYVVFSYAQDIQKRIHQVDFCLFLVMLCIIFLSTEKRINRSRFHRVRT
mmetsp:Transcript_17843/g.41279  ORF Transcript_17843/g.41279 Transcript_17843/m.41279 type:complete len:166 (-) Transcript_17843:795-1292(-)